MWHVTDTMAFCYCPAPRTTDVPCQVLDHGAIVHDHGTSEFEFAQQGQGSAEAAPGADHYAESGSPGVGDGFPGGFRRG